MMSRLWRGRLALAIAVTAFAVTVIPVRGTSATPAAERLRLNHVGDKVFWDVEDGAPIGAHVPDRKACGVSGPCWEYELDVAESVEGTGLRIALTAVMGDPGDVRPWADSLAKSPEMHFKVELYKPGSDRSGTPYESRENGELHGYSLEIVVGGPQATGPMPSPPSPGTWLLRVIPMSMTDMGIRLRAALVDETRFPSGIQLPDLRFNPPFELTFGTVPATTQPGITATHDGPHPSCMTEEVAEAIQSGFDPPQLCLRFTMGLENVGSGAFGLIWQRPADEAEAASQVGGATLRHQLQRACNFFGTYCEYLPDRGIQTLFHWGHAHEHWVNAWSTRLYRISDENWRLRGAAPTMEHVGDARKLGINPAPELIADWGRIWPRSSADIADNTGCFRDDGGACAGFFPILLPAGYADLYEWNRGGNYVEFRQGDVPLTPKSGVYVLTATADPDDLVAESDERNNDSYAVFEVASDGAVTLLERGYGTSPWDGNKRVSHVAP